MTASTAVAATPLALGDVLGLDTASTVYDRVIASSLSSGMILSTAIVGVCGQAVSSGGAGTVIPVWEANPMVEFRAATRGAVVNSTIVGSIASLDKDSTLGITMVRLGTPQSTAIQQRVVITGIVPPYVSGDSGGHVSFRFLTKDPVGSTAFCLAFYK
jgi:hypothetical protein